jgi:hypothetical protein
LGELARFHFVANCPGWQKRNTPTVLNHQLDEVSVV